MAGHFPRRERLARCVFAAIQGTSATTASASWNSCEHRGPAWFASPIACCQFRREPDYQRTVISRIEPAEPG
jgi:hypothetical protein